MVALSSPLTNSDQLLRWWHQSQAQWLNDEADAIRNSLLQDLFAVRRKLEMLNPDSNPCLQDIEHLYHALDHLGNRLSSPYIYDSLPLAIQHTLKPWETALPVAADLPTQWSAEAIEHIRLVLSVLDHLLKTLAALPHPVQRIKVGLTETGDRKHLTLQVEPGACVADSLLSLGESEDWVYRLQTFQLLTQGEIQCIHEPTCLTWRLGWSTHPAD